MNNYLIKVITCPTCKEEHFIWSYDIAGEWACRCETNLSWYPPEPDWDSIVKDDQLERETHGKT